MRRVENSALVLLRGVMAKLTAYGLQPTVRIIISWLFPVGRRLSDRLPRPWNSVQMNGAKARQVCGRRSSFGKGFS